MKKSFNQICLAAALTVGSTMAQADVSVGGVTWDPDYAGDFFSVTAIAETVTTVVGTGISGFGEITSVNNYAQHEFCPSGCELTYVFSGYTLLDINSTGPGTSGIDPVTSGFAFGGGTLDVFVDPVADFDMYTADGLARASGGVLWLSLTAVTDPTSGYAAFGSTLEGTLDSLIDVNGHGNGYFDVTGGLAAANFDTNNANDRCVLSMGTFCPDFFFESDFDLDPLLVAAGAGFTHRGSADLNGHSIPEPSTIALIGLSLFGLGFARRRKEQS